MFFNRKIPAVFLILVIFFIASCATSRKADRHMTKRAPTTTNAGKGVVSSRAKTFVKPLAVNRNEVVNYAKSLMGTRYKYGSSDPRNGLDCSGFIYNVLGKFNIASPRRSVDFTYEGREVELHAARPGDLILFTGSDNASGVVGHMGIVTENKNGKLFFVHSASGKNVGVILNELKGYYITHFVKVISIFE